MKELKVRKRLKNQITPCHHAVRKLVEENNIEIEK